MHICIYKYLYLEREGDKWSSHTTRVYTYIPCFSGLLYMMGIAILHLELHVINTYIYIYMYIYLSHWYADQSAKSCFR